MQALAVAARLSPEIPRTLYIKDVEREGAEPTDFGGRADIFQGKYKGQLVALKRYRVARQDPEKRLNVGSRLHHHLWHACEFDYA
jgi:hypothetical protein